MSRTKHYCFEYYIQIIKRYFTLISVAILTLFFSSLIVMRFALSLQTPFALLLCWALVALAVIDLKHFILPNKITMSFLFLGLLLNTFGLFATFNNAFFGATLGFTFFFVIHYFYKKIFRRDGLGFGDIKLLAMLGAWLGWEVLPFIVFYASLLGSGLGIFLILRGKASRYSPLPFGAYLSLAGIMALV